MIKKTITFTDYNDTVRTEDFYFHLSKAEITEMELVYGGLSEYLSAMVISRDGAKLVATFKEIISKAYGKKSEDGRQFIKNPELLAEFLNTDAYSVLFMELLQDESGEGEKVSEFIRGILPKDLSEKLPANLADLALPTANTTETEVPAWIAENRDPTKTELTSMSPEQLTEVFRRKNAAPVAE